MSRTKLNVDALALQTYYVQSEIYDLGRTTDDFDGGMLPVYDRERTICDCFKYRSRLDSEIFSKALNAYAKETKGTGYPKMSIDLKPLADQLQEIGEPPLLKYLSRTWVGI